MKTDYPSVLLIYTGGTIGMIENPETGALETLQFGNMFEKMIEVEIFKRTCLWVLYHADGSTGIN